MLGANGAGKSSLLKALMGLEPAAARPRSRFDGADITRWPPSRARARAGSCWCRRAGASSRA